MFNREFFSSVLPEHVRAEVASNPGRVPSIELYLGSGAVLDLCHVVRLADNWVAVARFCDDRFDSSDLQFIPYGTIIRVSLSMHDKKEREIGFSMATPPLEVPAGAPIPMITPPERMLPAANSQSETSG